MKHLPIIRRYFLGVFLVAAATGVGALIAAFISPTNLVVVYLLSVVLAAIYLGRGPAIMTSFLGVAAFDFFFIPPHFTLAVSDTEYLLTFFGLMAVGLIISQLTTQVHRHAEEVQRREAHTELLRATEKLQTALLNSISHDLRTPLVSITGTLSSLEEGPVMDAEVRHGLIRTAREEANRLNRLVGNLLDMTRLEAGALQIQFEASDIEELIGSTLEQFGSRLDEHQVSVNLPQELPMVPMDFVLIEQVLLNILDNALKYSPVGTLIEIEGRVDGKNLEISVADRGLGIPSDDLLKVFDKFYRVQRPGNVTGTGLGLSISKGIIEAHGGSIQAKNRQGGGTIVSIKMPLERKA